MNLNTNVRKTKELLNKSICYVLLLHCEIIIEFDVAETINFQLGINLKLWYIFFVKLLYFN